MPGPSEHTNIKVGSEAAIITELLHGIGSTVYITYQKVPGPSGRTNIKVGSEAAIIQNFMALGQQYIL